MGRRASMKGVKRDREAPPVLVARRRALFVGGMIAALIVAVLTVWALRWRSPLSPKEEASRALDAGQAARGERALARASALDAADPRPWELRLEILRLEDRQVEAQRVGWEAYRAVDARDRRGVLRAMTLALLADTPEDLARSTLARWTAADPDDVDAQVALIHRIAASPRAGDPDRAAGWRLCRGSSRRIPITSRHVRRWSWRWPIRATPSAAGCFWKTGPRPNAMRAITGSGGGGTSNMITGRPAPSSRFGPRWRSCPRTGGLDTDWPGRFATPGKRPRPGAGGVGRTAPRGPRSRGAGTTARQGSGRAG